MRPDRSTERPLSAAPTAPAALRRRASVAVEDIVKSYDLHANAYVAKPADSDAFADVVKKIDEFFGSVAELPPG